MDKINFWRIIDTARDNADGNAEAQLDELQALLQALEPEEIVSFDRWLSECHNRAYTEELWGAAYVIGGGCSDDGFMDFRGWLISRGEKIFEAAVADPDSLALALTEEDEDCQVEGYQYVAADVWSKKTGADYKDFPKHSIEYRSEPTGESWEEEDLDALFPKLSKLFA